MTLRDLIAADVQQVLMNTEDFAEVVSYRQGTLPPFDIIAVMTMTDYEVADENLGFFTVVVLTDWQVRQADFDTAGVKPRAGDLIAKTLNGIECLYELVPIDKRPAAEWSDTFGLLLLLHSKKVH